MTFMKIVQFSGPSIPLVHLHSNSAPSSLTLDVQFQTASTPHPPFPNDNQSIKKAYSKDDYYILSGPSFRSAFVFSINPLILSGFPLTSFHLAEAFSWLYTLECAIVQKYHAKCILFIIIHIFNLCMWTNELKTKKQVTSHPSWPRAL